MTRIGFVGVGAISGIYLENITNRFKDIEIIGVCDLIRERAENAVKKYNIPKLYNDMYELFADPEVDIVLNITRPYEHYEVTKAALLAGKPVYSEKPLGATWEEGVELVKLAEERGLWIAGAPDTYLGAGIRPIAVNLLRIGRDGTVGLQPLPSGLGRHGDALVLGVGKARLDLHVAAVMTVLRQKFLPALAALTLSPHKELSALEARRG